jgi:hypothetical protein
MKKTTSFRHGFPKLLRTHPPLDFSDSDCRLVVSEDWIQVYHYFTLRSAGVENKTASTKSNQIAPSYQHQEMSPYELALLLWRVLDIESVHAQDKVHNIHTNVQAEPQSGKGSGGNDESAAENGDSIDQEDASPERWAEACNDRSQSFSRILRDLEQSADAEVEIDAKKKLGLRQFTEYRSRRALSRMVFPVLAYVTSHPSPSVFV